MVSIGLATMSLYFALKLKCPTFYIVLQMMMVIVICFKHADHVGKAKFVRMIFKARDKFLRDEKIKQFYPRKEG